MVMVMVDIPGGHLSIWKDMSVNLTVKEELHEYLRIHLREVAIGSTSKCRLSIQNWAEEIRIIASILGIVREDDF